MITPTFEDAGSGFALNASVGGLAIYLDNFAIIDLAKGDPLRRQRFVSVIRDKGDLLFSVSNVVDLIGPQGRSLEQVRSFLDELGAHWFPVELDAFEVVQRELRGEPCFQSCLSHRFLRDYFIAKVRDVTPLSGKIISLSEDFFRLGSVLDWIGPQRTSIRSGLIELDRALVNRVEEYRLRAEADSTWLDSTFPLVPFNPSKRVSFAYVHLVRILIMEAKARRLKAGDGLDFCHAVLASAASAAALDKHWKRRIGKIPEPHRLASIYYQPELDRMVSDLESFPAATS